MVDQPHSEQPPERKAPSERSSRMLKGLSAVGFLVGTTWTVLGAISIAKPNFKNPLSGNVDGQMMGLLNVGAGLSLTAGSYFGWQHANFAGIVREANKRDELLLQRASIDKELAQQHSR